MRHLFALFLTVASVGCAHRSAAIWIDTDAAVGVKDRDVDDGVALVQAFHSPELAIAGVSSVFGNAELRDTHPITQRFSPLPVAKGAAKAGEGDTEAARAIVAAAGDGEMTVLALGPLTNVAAALKLNPGLKIKVIAVAGRRPNQRFTTGTRNAKAHRDFNFESDPEAMRTVVASGVPIVLAPFEISSGVWIREEDLAAFPPSLAGPARGWLKLWKDVFGVDGFNPFDTLAVAYLTSPQLLSCERLPIEIRELPDDVTETRMQGTRPKTKLYLLAAKEIASGHEATYCYRAAPAFKADLLKRLRE